MLPHAEEIHEAFYYEFLGYGRLKEEHEARTKALEKREGEIGEEELRRMKQISEMEMQAEMELKLKKDLADRRRGASNMSRSVKPMRRKPPKQKNKGRSWKRSCLRWKRRSVLVKTTLRS